MRVLLTGITGNLGYEVCQNLAERGIKIVPCIRHGKKGFLSSLPVKFDEIVECDLLEEEGISYTGKIDCIVHCAGVVKFNRSQDKNEQMMLKVIELAKKIGVPVYAISTAFVYRPSETDASFNNDYEKDKFRAEQVLVSSGIPHTIFRPSILTGNSQTGEIQNFSGYYLLIRAFLSALHKAKENNILLRFPRMHGESNIIPVDQAAENICKIIEEESLGETLYITNPAPPSADWLLNESLNFYGIRNQLDVLDISFQEFEKLNLTEEEAELYRFTEHFNPYWSMKYKFPKSVCTSNIINSEYIKKALTFFNKSEHSNHEQENN